ncbi:MAG: type I restriction enzyme HsdR N-terminal domain-containing protein [Deltaproteobacteria bacterium]|jgi:hypothetical protein|nr:type I restriction enzyme HsdR N-terminal domain-containing protein [Deltaproteobacteria bacterium]MBW2536969.1 type I restriction enzyme HsdR N-terminal domain-containing protein [Deltaproteobacteria bacterium]
MGRPLVLGTLSDYVTGATIDDTEDERLRQQIAHRLIDRLGYERSQLTVGACFEVRSGRYRAAYRVDFAVALAERTALVIRYCPGALVAPERPSLALARLCRPYVVPRLVVTNGVDARLLDVDAALLLGTGLAAIPHHDDLATLVARHRFAELDADRRGAEARILVAFEALECECDRIPCTS